MGRGRIGVDFIETFISMYTVLKQFILKAERRRERKDPAVYGPHSRPDS